MKSAYDGSESISYLGPKIWEIVPAKIKETNPLVGTTKLSLQTLQTIY